jgi:hypothetical protein
MTEDLATIQPLKILDTVLGMNIPHYLPKPETSRWNRKHTEVAEWYVKFHTISYPLQEGHLFHWSGTQIEVPQLVMNFG